MVLSQKQIEDLNRVVNNLPMSRLIGFAKDGTITHEVLEQLTSINPERKRAILEAIDGPSQQPAPNTPPPRANNVPPLRPVQQRPTPPPPVQQQRLTPPPPVQQQRPTPPPVQQQRPMPPVQQQRPTPPPPPVQQPVVEAPRAGKQLPDMNIAIAQSKTECATGNTDVFLIGAPLAGKTSMLMSLLESKEIDIDTTNACGPYAAALRSYHAAGLDAGQTPAEFIATVNAIVTEDTGEQNKFTIVDIPGTYLTQASERNMAAGTPPSASDLGAETVRLMQTQNRKVLLFVIDPTAVQASYSQIVNNTDAAGVVRTYMVQKNVNQPALLIRMAKAMLQDGSQALMQNVGTVHIIVTKADTLGEGNQREFDALKHVTTNYAELVDTLCTVCRKYGMNRATECAPMLFTISSGNDTDKLIEILRGNTATISI